MHGLLSEHTLARDSQTRWHAKHAVTDVLLTQSSPSRWPRSGCSAFTAQPAPHPVSPTSSRGAQQVPDRQAHHHQRAADSDHHKRTSHPRTSQAERCAPKANRTRPTVDQRIAPNPTEDGYRKSPTVHRLSTSREQPPIITDRKRIRITRIQPRHHLNKLTRHKQGRQLAQDTLTPMHHRPKQRIRVAIDGRERRCELRAACCSAKGGASKAGIPSRRRLCLVAGWR